MKQRIRISKLLILFLSLIIFNVLILVAALPPMAGQARAATMQIEDIPLGGVIEINGQKFTKVRDDQAKGSQFLATQILCSPNATPYFTGMMQEFDAVACNNIPTPSGTCYVYVGTLTDSRDGKSYEVRKFADGKCWMVDNLAYGGGTDGASDYCAGKATFRDAISAADTVATATNGLNPTDGTRNTMVGDCRDPRAAGNGTVSALCTVGSTTCGYYYNWSAAIQDVNGWYGNSYQPTEPTTGICPSGWHIPTGKTTGEYQALHTAVNSNVAFWQASGSWKGVFSGRCLNSGSLSYQGYGGYYWSSTQINTYRAYLLDFDASGMNPAFFDNKSNGFPIRCIKDTTERTMQSFTTADCAAYPTPSGTDYTPVGQLKDERDGKWYEIRKFADGKCWMVDNLMYGGGSGPSADYCAGKATFRNANSAANAVATATNGLNPPDGSRNTLVGDCRDPRAAGNGTVAAPCTASSTTCGYLYNWPAAIQNTNGWYGNSFQPSEPATGICPPGWHIPTGNTSGEYQALHTAVSSNLAFWQNTGSWKGVLSGRCNTAGGLYSQGSYGLYWSSTQDSAYDAYDLYFNSSAVYPGTNYLSKSSGLAIRCVKN